MLCSRSVGSSWWMASGDLSTLPDDYAEVLAALKNRVREARITAQRRVNSELIDL